MIQTINGYTVIQDEESYCISLHGSDGAVMHATCSRQLSPGELKSVVADYLNFRRRIKSND